MHAIAQLICEFRNMPEVTASSSCCCSAHGLSSSLMVHCVMHSAQPVSEASVNIHATSRRSRKLVVIVSRRACLMCFHACVWCFVHPAASMVICPHITSLAVFQCSHDEVVQRFLSDREQWHIRPDPSYGCFEFPNITDCDRERHIL